MTATTILAELDRYGVTVEVIDAEHLYLRPRDRIPPALLDEIRRRKTELLRALAHGGDAYRELATSDLAERYGRGLDWLVEHCPENFAALKAEDDRGADPERMRSIMAAGLAEYDRAHGLKALRIYSRVLDAEVWLAPDDETAADLRAELAAEGDTRPVWTCAEVRACERMAEGDLRTIARIKEAIPEAALRSFAPRRGDA